MRAVGLFLPTVAAICEMRYLWRTPFPQALRKALDDLGMLAPLGSAAGQVSLSPR